MNHQAHLKQYQKAKISSVETSRPHELILQLLVGACERVLLAKGALQRKDMAVFGENIGKVISIVEYLKSILDHDKGGEVTEKLEVLYDYVIRRLLYANLHKDVSVLDEVNGLLQEIRSGWQEIN